MPQATSGRDDGDSYSYSYSGTIAEAQAFYEAEMPKRGWSLLTAGEGPTGALLLIYQNAAGESATISILPLTEGTVLVLLIR